MLICTDLRWAYMPGQDCYTEAKVGGSMWIRERKGGRGEAHDLNGAALSVHLAVSLLVVFYQLLEAAVGDPIGHAVSRETLGGKDKFEGHDDSRFALVNCLADCQRRPWMMAHALELPVELWIVIWQFVFAIEWPCQLYHRQISVCKQLYYSGLQVWLSGLVVTYPFLRETNGLKSIIFGCRACSETSSAATVGLSSACV